VRRKLLGTSLRPRLCVFRSLKHIHAQIVDDSRSQTLVSMSTLDPRFRAIASQSTDSEEHEGERTAKQGHQTTKTEKARVVGSLLAEKALSKGIKQVVFDRGGHKYHGRVKALAEAAREAGLLF